MARMKTQAGFTIVEVMVAAAILMTGVLGTLAMLDTANKRSKSSANRQAAVALTRDLAEAAREIPYRDVANATIVSRLQQNDNLRGNASATAWRIQRGPATFTVRASVCAVDDPSDGSGSHAEGGFCAGGKPGGTTDANAADYRIVTVTASWSDGGATKSVEEHVLVSSGSKDRPGVDSIAMLSPSSPTITSA